MKYTRKKDVIEITFLITIIVFFIITSFAETLSNKSMAKKSYQESLSNNFQNVIESNNITNEINGSNINSAQNITNSTSKNNVIKRNILNTNSTISNNVNGKKTNEIKDKQNKWRIEIPKIGLNAPIKEGTTQEIMLEAVGHFTETTKDTGNVGLAAHNRGYECNFFERIKELNKGDKIIYKTANKTRIYLVEVNTVIKQTNWNYLKSTKDNRITLITCEKDKKEYRRCIQAVEIS